MNTKLLEKVPFKEKRLMVSETLLLFGRMKHMKEQSEALGNKASDIVRATIGRNFRGVSMIEAVLSLLSAEHKLILENDFIEDVDPMWYLKEWSKTTYYKLKHEAIDKFIYLLYA